MSRGDEQLLLGEWACLGILCSAPSHGFAVAARLKPDGDLGRVWSMSRALTYRALDQLADRGFVRAAGQEPGLAGGKRTILAATEAGRVHLGGWLVTPVTHLRDLRSELLLKLVLGELCGIDMVPMLQRQRMHTARLAEALVTDVTAQEGASSSADVVRLWRQEQSQAALRFLDAAIAGATRTS